MVKKHFKHFIGYKKNKKVRPLSIILPKMVAYRSDFDETEYMPFLIKDDKLLEKYDKISDKVCNRIRKEFDCEPLYNRKYLKSQSKSYAGKINTNSH